jgi:hypothetical protein
VLGGTEVGHILLEQYKDPPATDGKDWYGLIDDERHPASQLCYSRRTFGGAPHGQACLPLHRLVRR